MSAMILFIPRDREWVWCLYSGRIQDFSKESKRRLVAVVEEFDPHTELWQQKNVTGQTPAPGMYAAASVAVKDDLFMFGGQTDGIKKYVLS